MAASQSTTVGQPPLLAVERLCKFYVPRHGWFGTRDERPIRAVDDVSFSIVEGETFGLVGESGCGKTTVLRSIMRAIDPTSGSIRFRSRSAGTCDLASLGRRQLRPLRHEMQLIFQNPFTSLNPRMRLFDLIGEPLLVAGMKSRSQRTGRVSELLEMVGLPPQYMWRYAHAFSGGERQRIGIARALALQPRLLVADEPVSALDVSIQAQVLNLLLDLKRRLGLTLLFVSHDLSVVRLMCDRVAVMYLGKIVETAPTETLFNAPRHPYTSALLSAVPVADPRLRSGWKILPGEVPSPAQPPSGCHFHPRCAFAIEPCSSKLPPLEAIETGHQAACLRAHEWAAVPNKDPERVRTVGN